jgi:hypothetical protein
MSELKNKKGFSIIEVVCGTALLTIFMCIIFSVRASTLNFKKYNTEIENNIVFIEALKNNLLYNMSYDDMVRLKNSKKYYVYSENLNLDSLMNQNFNSIFSEDLPQMKPYLSIQFQEGEIIRVDIKLYTALKNKKVLNYTFYRGNY